MGDSWDWVSQFPFLPDAGPCAPRFYLSCTGFPECRSVMWLPDFVLEACRDESVCPVCQPHPVHR